MVRRLAAFWASWGIIVLAAANHVGVVAGIAGVVSLASVFGFYLAYFSVSAAEAGERPWKMMFLPSFNRRARASRQIGNLLRPSYIAHTLKETGWPPRLVGGGLLAILAVDLTLFAFMLPSTTRR